MICVPKRQQLAFADQEIACTIRSRNLLELGDLRVADLTLIFRHRAADAPEILSLLAGV